MQSQHIPRWFRNINFFNDEFIDTRIPAALSNNENRLLEENVEVKMKEITSKQLEIEENNDRIRLLEEHHKIVQDELQTIQRLLVARQREETTEQSQIDIDLAEIQRLERLTTVLDNDLIKFTQRKTHFQTEINGLNQEISKINNETLIEKDKLQKLIDSLKKRDDEAFCFIKYTRQDDVRIKELTSQLERCSERTVQLKRANEEEVIEYSTDQVELDKIAETFRRSHKQRQQLINQWETILIQMQRKDYDIDHLALELVQIKAQSRTKEQDLQEQKIFHDREQKNNFVIEKLIDLAEQKIQTLKVKQKSINEKQEHLETENLSLKTVLVNTQNSVQREHAFINELKTSIVSKQRELTKLKQHHEQILDRQRFILNEKFSINEKLSKLEKLMENGQKYQNHLNNQYRKCSEILFLLNNDVSSLRKREQQHETDHQTFRNQIRNLKNQTNKFDQQLLKQQELIYHQDFLRQSVDRRLNRISGEKNNVKTSELDIKTRELKTDYEKKKSQYDQLQNQIKLLNEELRLNKQEFDQLNEEKKTFNEKFLQFDLYLNLSEKMTKKLTNEKEDYLVDVNLHNVELKRLKTILHNSSEINSSLEEQQIEIRKAMKERRMEVQANCQLFRLRFNDERTKKITLSTELSMRITKITKLKHRYESSAGIINIDNTSEDNIREQAQHVIKSAQMKEDLFQQGDHLEALVIKAETELRALENTVQVLKWNNLDVKKTYDKLNESSPEMCQMNELEEHLRAVTEQVKLRRKLLKDLRKNRETISYNQISRPTVEDEIEQTNRILARKSQIQTQLEDDVEQYRIKTFRADQFIKRFQQNLEDVEQEKLDIDVRLQRETNKKIEQQLISLCLTSGDTNLIDTFEQLSTEHGSKITIKQQNKKIDRKSSSSFSNVNLIPNIVNISIDRDFHL